jgi:hypothetical protein
MKKGQLREVTGRVGPDVIDAVVAMALILVVDVDPVIVMEVFVFRIRSFCFP